MRRATALLALPLAAVALAGYTNIVINGNGAHLTRNVNGIVTVNGNKNELTLKGTASVLRVAGNNNKIRVDRVATIETPGNGNTIEWHAGPSPTGKPKISNLGNGNKITQK